MRHIVIVGGGFAGMRLARKLGDNKNMRVSLINPSANFRYTPALYRAASGFKSGTAWLPLEWMLLDTKNVSLIVGTAQKINDHDKTITLSDNRVIEYDEVVFAIGNVTSYFDIPGLDKYSYGVKSAEEISRLKKHIHENVLHPDKAATDYIVVGAGPTGVELAAVLGAHIRRIASQHKAHVTHVKVHLIEAGPRVLQQMTENAAAYAMKQLRSNGVHVHTDMQVKSESLHELKTTLGAIETDNVIWTAGTMNNAFFQENQSVFKLDHKGKVIVDRHLQASQHVYVCGDNVATPHSGLALTAIEHANFIADDLNRRSKGKKRKIQVDPHPIQVIPVGEKHAVLQYRGFVLSGKLVSLMRKAADIIGYTDILGPLKAYTIWRSSELEKDACDICGR